MVISVGEREGVREGEMLFVESTVGVIDVVCVGEREERTEGERVGGMESEGESEGHSVGPKEGE